MMSSHAMATAAAVSQTATKATIPGCLDAYKPNKAATIQRFSPTKFFSCVSTTKTFSIFRRARK
jgi:sulfur transfer protein SufE